MDLQMPEMNGVDALIAICAEFPAARFIVLTTYTGDVQVMCALKAGAQASTWPERLRLTHRISSAIQHGIQDDDRSEAVPQVKTQRVPFFGD
jgi:DNA-binding NarL/FixJ family response regulator